MRAPFQVLVIPFIQAESETLFATLRRADAQYLQFVAGGGEGNESPIDAAKREFIEETGHIPVGPIIELQSMTMIPVDFVSGRIWGDDVLVIPEHSFGARVENQDLIISDEHTEFCWARYSETFESLKWDSNRNALWELNERLKNKDFLF